MNRQGYFDFSKKREIEQTRENARLIEYQELKEKGILESCYFDELNKTNIKGFPYASDFSDDKGHSVDYEDYLKLDEEERKNYRLRFYYLPYMHELYIGTTGSGKTTTCLEPQIRAITAQKNKPNIFVSDPKGEIFLHNAKYLRENGYNVQILNFKNTRYSQCWNPLEELYIKEKAIEDIGKDAIYVKSNKVEEGLALADAKSEFKNGYHIVFDGKAFPNYQTFNEYVGSLKSSAHADVTSLANQLCSQMFPDEQSSNDPTWSNGAREFMNGIMLALLDDCHHPEKNFTKQMFNVRTLNDVYTLVSKYRGNDDNPDSNKLDEFLKGKPKEAADKIELVAKTADSTRKGFLSTCQSMIGKWMNGHIFALTMETNIDLDDSKNPVALFIVTRDYDKSDNAVAGLFLNWVYRQFLEKAEKNERVDGISGGRPLHFLLDEFANIPAIPDFDIKIATSRSRNMWFHIYIQSYEQLDNVYNPTTASIIVDNCNQQTFLGSQSFTTKERFARECGQGTLVNKKDESFVTLPVLPISELNNVDPGWLYIKRNRWNAVCSTYIRSYQCAKEGIFKDFDNDSFEKLAPLNMVNPMNRKYSYDKVIPDIYLVDSSFLTLESLEEDDDEPFFTRYTNRRGGGR